MKSTRGIWLVTMLLVVQTAECIVTSTAAKPVKHGPIMHLRWLKHNFGHSLFGRSEKGEKVGQTAAAMVAIGLISKISPQGLWRTFGFWRRALPLLLVSSTSMFLDRGMRAADVCAQYSFKHRAHFTGTANDRPSKRMLSEDSSFFNGIRTTREVFECSNKNCLESCWVDVQICRSNQADHHGVKAQMCLGYLISL
jgi:hypothetical protein